MANESLTQMSRALSTGVRLLSRLDESIRAHGGPEEALYLLATNVGKENLDRIGAFTAQLEWRYPMSKIMQLARKLCDEEEYSDNDELFFWEPALRKLKIPFLRFYSTNADIEESDFPLKEIENQLQGLTAAAGLLISWKGEQYVVASIGIGSSGPTPGESLDVKGIEFIHLVSTRFIDITS